MVKQLKHETLYPKIKVLSNKHRFKIVKLTQEQALSITELSSELGLAYNKCINYVTMLEKEGLIEKTRSGKEVLVSAKVKLSNKKIEF